MEIIASGNTTTHAIINEINNQVIVQQLQTGIIELANEINNQVIVQQPQTSIIELTTAGPQGPASFGFADFAQIQNVNATNKTDKSLVYYDENTDTYKVDSLVTISKLSDGGNF